MANWDWRIDPLVRGEYLFANSWHPRDVFTYDLPTGYDGPVYGLARFYNTRSASSFEINGISALAPVPLPGALLLMVAALGALSATRTRT